MEFKKDKENVYLNGIDGDATANLVKFVYTGEFLGNVNNGKCLHVAADYFTFENAAIVFEDFYTTIKYK